MLGILLAAIGVDANGSLFPLTHAVVDIENNDNWLWFMQLLHCVVNDNAPEFLHLPEKKLCFLSDHQKGILEAMDNTFPGCPHGYCLKSLEECLWKQFHNKELCVLLWKGARATEQAAFDKIVADMNAIDPHKFPWLEANAHPRHWADLFFEGRQYDHFTSNIAESLNVWLLQARQMPLLPMLEMIRDKTMEWFRERCSLEDRTVGLLVSKRAKELQTTVNVCAHCYRFYECTNVIYEVESKETR